MLPESPVLVQSLVRLASVRDDPQNTIGQQPLQSQGLRWRRCHPCIHLFLRPQNNGHGLRVDRAHLRVRIDAEEAEDAVGRLAFPNFVNRGPSGPDAGEAGERPCLVEVEPHRRFAAKPDVIRLGKAVERHQTATFDIQLATPMRRRLDCECG